MLRTRLRSAQRQPASPAVAQPRGAARVTL